jgi:hypothetical protein
MPQPTLSPISTSSNTSKEERVMRNYKAVVKAINDFNIYRYEYLISQLANNGVVDTSAVDSTVSNNISSMQSLTSHGEPSIHFLNDFISDITDASSIKFDSTILYLPKDFQGTDHLKSGETYPGSSAFDSSSDYNGRKQQIQTMHNEIMNMRNDLDIKLQQLYQTNNSILYDYKMGYDTSMYVGILWTILATSVLYYVFVKL